MMLQELGNMKRALLEEIVQAVETRSWLYTRICGGVLLIFGVRWLYAKFLRLNRFDPENSFSALDVCRAFAHYLKPSGNLAESAKVQFTWNDPHPVGNSMKLHVKLYQRGKPYLVHHVEDVNFSARATCGGTPIDVAVDVAKENSQKSNVISLCFTAKRAGVYVFIIRISDKLVSGSPFVRTFLAGSPDPGKTSVVQKLSTIVTSNQGHTQVALDPFDEFENRCCVDSLCLDDFEMTVTELVRECKPEVLQVRASGLLNTLFFSKTFAAGIYAACVTLKGRTISGGKFKVISLSASEFEEVSQCVGQKKSEDHESYITCVGSEEYSKPKKVFAYISSKQLVLREFILGLLPVRFRTFRVSLATTFDYVGMNDKLGFPAVTFTDDNQASVTFASKDAMKILSIFAMHLSKNIGGSETFVDKQEFFYCAMRRHHNISFLGEARITVDRSNLLSSSMHALRGSYAWFKKIRVIFSGEPGLDHGGVSREWFDLLSSKIFSPETELFVPFSNNPQALVHPNPNRSPLMTLKFYEFAGKLAGKCLFESSHSSKQFIKARLSRSFLAQLIGLRVDYKFFEYDDPDLYVSKIKYILNSSVNDLDLTFTEEEFDNNGKLVKVVDLVPGGKAKPVSDENKIEYINALARYRLVTKVKSETQAFLKGFNAFVPEDLIMIFDEKELELLLCGVSEYDVKELQKNCIVSGRSPKFQKVLRWFWTIVGNYTQEEMARLLQFTTGSSQLPPGGFSQLIPKFQITEDFSYNILPKAHTCFNQLNLPDYESFEKMERCMLVAIKEGSEGFLLG
ncbi:apoptosis-resistant E3 ubiquitin protein ligase 1-like [Artemia franciscana]|uniref:HECT-type E3 ubiquitin transferase n=1 Tax=Artemia franciscana TaxID=6661 RepID=A0AA88HL20_ARTSF|nr:hypothetical protein QYM36_014752 [Artemia franciscana]KAK2706822.1 hypothetical protein QYM36_014752 [Artemia franciscana]